MLTMASVLFFSSSLRGKEFLGEAVWERCGAKPLAPVQMSNQHRSGMGFQGKVRSIRAETEGSGSLKNSMTILSAPNGLNKCFHHVQTLK